MKRIGYFYANPKTGKCVITQHNSLVVRNSPNDFKKEKGYVILDVWFEDVLKGLENNANYFFYKKSFIKFKEECLSNAININFEDLNEDEIPDDGGIGVGGSLIQNSQLN